MVCPCPAVRQVPLAANANSVAWAGGIPSGSTSDHVWPPSVVSCSRNTPSTGSLTASPRCGVLNAMQS